MRLWLSKTPLKSGHLHIIGDQVDRIKADAKLADEIHIAALLQVLQERCMHPLIYYSVPLTTEIDLSKASILEFR